MPLILLLIGSGPGIGAHTASLFTTHSTFSHIALVARTPAQLQQDRATVLAAAQKSGREVEIRTFAVDIAATTAFEGVLAEVQSLGPLGCVVFNAARVGPSGFFDAAEGLLVADFMTTTTALYTLARWAMPLLRASPSPQRALLVTSSELWKEPLPELFALSVAKAAQRTLVLCLQRAFADVHVALLSVPVRVGEGEGMVRAGRVAEGMWELWRQERGRWVGELGV
ncbi:hypothetical protein MMC13_001626 [Lambiella insularis]|nr:hypothetical protein [Lambiella insularis]